MWICLNTIKHIEVRGKNETYNPGDWVNVGKMTAKLWLATGDAWLPTDQPFPRKQSRRGYPPVFRIPLIDIIKIGPQRKARKAYQPFTMFTVPRSWVGIYEIRQVNALESWLKQMPKPEILMFGDDEGTEAAAKKYGCRYFPDLRRNEFGTPSVGHAFEIAQREASNDLLCYSNTDIIYVGLDEALQDTVDRFKQFLMIGRRWNINIKHMIDFSGKWESRLCQDVLLCGELGPVDGIDFFAFKRGLYKDVPDFAIGRSAWDNWLVAHIANRKIVIVNARPIITAIHQDIPCYKARSEEWLRINAIERKFNRKYYDRESVKYRGTLKNANWLLDKKGFTKR